MPHAPARAAAAAARPGPSPCAWAWRGRQAGRRRRRRASGRAGEAFIFVTQFPLMELIGGVSVNSRDELIGGVSVNSRDFWLSVSVSPTAEGRCDPSVPSTSRLLASAYKSNPLLSVKISWRNTPLSSSASSSRSTSGEHQRWKSRPPERVSVVGFTCSGEDGRLRFWGVSVVARLLAGEPVAVPLHGVLFCTASSGTTTTTKHHHGLS